MRLWFDVTARVANPKAANGSPLVYQWKFTDAEPWHMIIDNGSTRAEPGLAADPAVTIEASWADWLASTKPDANPLKMVLSRKIRPQRRQATAARRRTRHPSQNVSCENARAAKRATGCQGGGRPHSASLGAGIEEKAIAS